MLSMQDGKVNRNGQPCPLVLFPGSLGDFLCFLPALEEIANSTVSGMVEIVARLFSQPGEKGEEASLLSFSVPEIFSWFGHIHPEVRANLDAIAPGRVQSFAFFTAQEDCHASAYYLRCLGVTELRGPSLLLGEEEGQWLDLYWRLHDWQPSSRMLIVHPGSGGRKKRWVSEGFTQVCRWW